MLISLKVISSLIVAVIVIIVGGTCIGVTLGTTLHTIYQIAEAWARGISHSISSSVLAYFTEWEAEMVSATALMQQANYSLPSVDRANGKNWTDFWIPYLLKLASKRQFQFSVIALTFADGYWIFTSPSIANIADRDQHQVIEWIENLQLNNSRLSVGGFRFNRQTFGIANYTNYTNYSYQIVQTDPNNLEAALPAEYFALHNANLRTHPSAVTSVVHTPMLATWIDQPSRKVAWEKYIDAALVARGSRTTLGFLLVGFDVENELNKLLIATEGSANSQGFIVQKDSSIVATTLPQKYWTSVPIYNYSKFDPIPPHCQMTTYVLPALVPPRRSCLMTTKTYPYKPLNVVPVDFVTSDSPQFDFFDADGATYAISAQQLVTTVGQLNLNIVSLIPESDLRLDQVRNRIFLAVGLGLALCGIAIIIAALAIHFSLRRLESIQRKMIEIANLRNLEDQEDERFLTGEEGDDFDEKGNQIALRGGSSSGTELYSMNDVNDDAVNFFFARAGTIKKKLASPRTKTKFGNNNSSMTNNKKADLQIIVSMPRGDDSFENTKNSTNNKNNKNVGANKLSMSSEMKRSSSRTTTIGDEECEDDDDEDDEDESDDANNNNNKRKKNREKRSWISEVAALEDAYAETVRNLTNFTRYVSRAVVSELIIQRKLVAEANTKIQANNESSNGKIVELANNKNNSNNNDDTGTSGTAITEYDISVLFCEIEGFSSNIWATNPENHDGVLYLLHIYFKRMCRLIMGHGGIVDKFLADSIMSYWGAPVKVDNHALLAALASLALLRETRRDPLKRIFESTVQNKLKLRCGIASGKAFVGTIGTRETVNFSVLGKSVTLAKRLQQFNIFWGSSVLVNASCMRSVSDFITSRLLCSAKFRPDEEPELVYEVIGVSLESRTLLEHVPAFIVNNIVASWRGGGGGSSGGKNNNNNNFHNTLDSSDFNMKGTNNIIDLRGADSDGSLSSSVTMVAAEAIIAKKPPSPLSAAAVSEAPVFSELHQQRHAGDDKNNNYSPTSSLHSSVGNNHLAATNVNATDDIAHKSNVNNNRMWEDTRSIALSDLLSLRTMQVDEGHTVGELLRAVNPEHSSVSSLLRWHVQRTYCSPGYTLFAESFSDVARAIIDRKFKDAKKLFEDMLFNAQIPMELRRFNKSGENGNTTQVSSANDPTNFSPLSSLSPKLGKCIAHNNNNPVAKQFSLDPAPNPIQVETSLSIVSFIITKNSVNPSSEPVFLNHGLGNSKNVNKHNAANSLQQHLQQQQQQQCFSLTPHELQEICSKLGSSNFSASSDFGGTSSPAWISSQQSRIGNNNNNDTSSGNNSNNTEVRKSSFRREASSSSSQRQQQQQQQQTMMSGTTSFTVAPGFISGNEMNITNDCEHDDDNGGGGGNAFAAPHDMNQDKNGPDETDEENNNILGAKSTINSGRAILALERSKNAVSNSNANHNILSGNVEFVNHKGHHHHRRHHHRRHRSDNVSATSSTSNSSNGSQSNSPSRRRSSRTANNHNNRNHNTSGGAQGNSSPE